MTPFRLTLSPPAQSPGFSGLFKVLPLLALLAMALAGPPARAQSPAPLVFGQAEVVVERADRKRLPFHVEVASTEEQLHQGLMFRESLPPDGGMLFILGPPQPASFWMRNTFIPLDIIFIARDGRITNIYPRAAPGSLSLINSSEPVTGVLEINGGMAARLGIRAGDRVHHAAFERPRLWCLRLAPPPAPGPDLVPAAGTGRRRVDRFW